MSAEFFRKYIDILNEFAPGGGEGSNGPMDYYLALKRMSESYVEDNQELYGTDDSGGGVTLSLDSSTDQEESDAYDIMQVAEAFRTSGMNTGREEFAVQDTLIREEMAEFLAGQGFNVQQDILDHI